MTDGVVLLAGEGESTRFMSSLLAAEFPLSAVIVEDAVPRKEFLRRRINKLGLARVAGQVAFQFAVIPVLRARARARLRQLRSFAEKLPAPGPSVPFHRVSSVNSDEARRLLVELNPRVVVLNGTRIVSKLTLDCVSAPFLNMHAGITPLYRGVHGAYWALASRQPDACGVTVHYVDTGIDTGGITGQSLVKPEAEDNFVTYPLLQFWAGWPLMRTALRGILDGVPVPVLTPPPGKSRLWSHPTLGAYLWNRLRKGVR